jgi:hypothetical protein
MELLQEFATDDEAAPGVIRHAAEVMDESGWSRAVDRVFDEAIERDTSVPLVGRFWVERRLNRQDHSCTTEFDDLIARGEIGTEALIAYLDGLGNARDATRLLPFVEKYREPLRKDTVAWGKTGWAFARVHRFDLVADWMSDWAKRDKPGSWMLINLAIALRAQRRDGEASLVGRHALQHAQSDPTQMYHAVWLAFDDALAGRTAQAARLTGQHEAESEHLDAYFRLVHDMTKAMIKVQQSGRRALAEAQKAIADSARENHDLDPDPAIFRAWQQCVSRLARDAFSIRAMLWKWRAAKNPPLPPLPPTT